MTYHCMGERIRENFLTAKLLILISYCMPPWFSQCPLNKVATSYYSVKSSFALPKRLTMAEKKPSPQPGAFNETVKESAQQIWLAGLGAFAKAQQEGGKVFETLVKDGLSMQRKAQTTAEEKIAEATQKMTTMAQELSSQASQFGSKASGSWDKLETIFEDRVARALARLGLPTAAEFETLNQRVAELEASLKASQARPKRVAAKKTPVAAKKAVKKK